MNRSPKSKVREREIYRHPDELFKAAFAAGRISAMPKLMNSFKVSIPPNEDFVVRHRNRTGKVCFLRGLGGRMTVFADRQFEIELIGTNAERWDRFVGAQKQAKLMANKPKNQAARGRKTR